MLTLKKKLLFSAVFAAWTLLLCTACDIFFLNKTSEYTVTFETNGGTPIEKQTVTAGDYANRPAAPEKDGFIFGGWYADRALTTEFNFINFIFIPVNGNITLYAKWLTLRTVTFNSSGGSEVPPGQTGDGRTVSRPQNPSKEGYGFAGWYSNEALTAEYDFYTPVTADITLYAKWDTSYYTVTFYSMWGSPVASQNIAHNGTATRPNDPAVSGRVFMGWSLNDYSTVMYDFDTPVTADITLYAQWLRNYIVTFNANNGSPAPASQTVISGNKAAEPAAMTRINHHFEGWFREATFINQWNFDSHTVTADITLYAKWERVGTVITSIDNIGAYLAAQAGGESAGNPVGLSVNIQLTEANWLALLAAINTAGKYVDLDLSLCTRSNENAGGGLRSIGYFDPVASSSIGKDKIVSFILPNAAETIFQLFSPYNFILFEHFNNLALVNAANVTYIADYTFKGCTALKSANFPAVTRINSSAFANCTALESVVMSGQGGNYTTLGSAFSGCVSLVSFTLIGTGSLSVIEDGKALMYTEPYGGGTRLCSYPSARGRISMDTITSIGGGAFSGASGLTGVSFPMIKDIPAGIFQGCTSLANIDFPLAESIGDYAFQGCTSLINLVGADFPLVTNIGEYAFSDCAALIGVDFPKVSSISVYAFRNCTSLTSVSFPMVKDIPADIFRGCIALASLNFPLAESIGNSAFRDCTALISVSFPTVKDIPDDIFRGCTALTSLNFPLAESIGNSAFRDCTGLINVNFPMVTAIDRYAFYGCTSLTNVSFPLLTEIGPSGSFNEENNSWFSPTYVFGGCTNLTGVNIPQATHIGDYAFQGCTGLTGVNFPQVTYIGWYSFDGCTGLTDVNFPQAMLIRTRAFGDCTSLTSVSLPEVRRINAAFMRCTSLTTVSFPLLENINGDFDGCTSLTVINGITDFPNVTRIGSSSFNGCTGLTSVYFPEVTEIDGSAFESCTRLISVDFPKLITIGDGDSYNVIGAFSRCTSLISINSPLVEYIGSYAFRNCTRLASADFPEAKSIGVSAFKNCTSLASVNLPKLTSIRNGYTTGTGTTVFWGVFVDCSSLVSAEFPSVTEIGSFAFYGCLTSANFPAAEIIGSYAFYGCRLTSITIPASVTTIGGYAFYNWTPSRTIYIEGYASQAAADDAWGAGWRSGCNAVIRYWNGSAYQ